MNKIIFLDIDGVLNSFEICDKNISMGYSGFGGWFEESSEEPSLENVLWGQKQVDYLKQIVEKTDARIVISSTWRKTFSVECFIKMFTLYGWDNAPIIGKTIVDNTIRGLQIAEWIIDNSIDTYCIIDDNNDFSDDQQILYIQTSINVGLQPEHVEQAINILNL